MRGIDSEVEILLKRIDILKKADEQWGDGWNEPVIRSVLQKRIQEDMDELVVLLTKKLEKK